MITANPTNARLKFVWDKQKPKLEPLVMMDVISAVAERVMPEITSSKEETWTDRVEAAAMKADPRFGEAFHVWRHSLSAVPGESGWADVPFVDAVVEIVSEIPEFKKASPIDGLIPWFAKEMNRIWLLSKDANAPEYPAFYTAKYARLQQALGEDPIVVEWFEKKKPNLSKLDAEDMLDAVEAFEQDRSPEVVYEWKDGYKIVKLVTRTQIQKEGDALDNCLQKGSSYTEGYCKLAESGKSAFYSLRDPAGESVISIQWTPGEKTPEQVYGANNEEPSEKEAERIEEWVSSLGGTYKPKRFANLSGSALRLAEYIDQVCGDNDDESIEHMAIEWDNDFSEHKAKEWISYVGCYGRDEANLYDNAGLDVEDVGKLPDSVREYISNGYTKDASELISMGLLAGMMEATGREPRPVPRSARVPEGQARLFGPEVFEQKPSREPTMPTWPRGFKPSGGDAMYLAWANEWIDAGWDDRDDFDDAALWWANWYSPEEAWIFKHDLAEYDRHNTNRVSYGITLPTANELRDRGIDALDVLDALGRSHSIVNIDNVDDIVAAVERSREWLKANKRRRSSRRPTRRR